MTFMRVAAPDGLNLRMGPSVEVKIIRRLAYDERVEILDPKPVVNAVLHWIQVQTYRGEDGYVAREYLNDEPKPPTMLLDVPYRSQEDVDARHFRNDCGPACLAMWIEYALNKDVGIDAISAASALQKRDDGLLSEQLAALGGQFGLKLKVNATPSMGLIRSEIDQARPVIALIWYKALTARQSAFGGGHFVVVVGYGDDSIWLNDPDWYGNRRKEGHQWRVPATQFVRALRQVVLAQ